MLKIDLERLQPSMSHQLLSEGFSSRCEPEQELYCSLIIWRQLVFHILEKGDPHLGRLISTKNVAHEIGLNLHLYLFEMICQH